ncbi:hypothetical protein ES707_07267 [subsurface metagenome]
MLSHLKDALTHMNYPITSHLRSKTEICRSIFDALNQTWIAFNHSEEEFGRTDSQSLYKLILKGMIADHMQEFLQSKELQSLVEFEPPIMNQYTLRRRGYRPNQEIGVRLRREATKEHSEAVNAYTRYKELPQDNTSERLIKKIAQLLYVVRSNIAHGEKTPYGPDLRKAERDEQVSEVVIPALLKLLQLIFDKPDQKLVVYGTLAPGACNEIWLKGIEGSWQDCMIRGEIKGCEGLPYFKWNFGSREIKVKMFISDYLPNELPKLDQFEGEEYHRILIPARIADYWIVTNVYQGKDV